MDGITRKEFNKFYKANLEPMLLDLEHERVMMQRILQPFDCLIVIFALVIVFCTLMVVLNRDNERAILFVFYIFISGFLLLPIKFILDKIRSKFNQKLKANITSKVLTMYGNMQFSDRKNIISSEKIREFDLFSFSIKEDGDIILGQYKGLNYVICETTLKHFSKRKDSNREPVIDFKGLILKFQMKKRFKGITVIGGCMSKDTKYQPVELESVDFMKDKKIYSTDQIEARYILTPSFMEKIDDFQDKYSPYDSVSIAFEEGYVYFFVPTEKNFFEIPLDKTLLNANNYYSIYKELDYILSVIDYLNLDQNLGL